MSKYYVQLQINLRMHTFKINQILIALIFIYFSICKKYLFQYWHRRTVKTDTECKNIKLIYQA